LLPVSPAAIFLSPHYDDVCFSLGQTARDHGAGHLINIFTHCNHVAVSSELPRDREELARVVTQMRAEEDRQFSEDCGLTRCDLQLSEATVVGLQPSDFSNIEGEVEQVEEKLVGLLLSQLHGSGHPTAALYCPMGMGRHRNHLSTFLVIIKRYAALRARARIFFYEELPYASNVRFREEGLQRLAHYFPQAKLERHIRSLTTDEFRNKLRWVGLYKSQHSGPVLESRLIPADPLNPAAHEAYWEVL